MTTVQDMVLWFLASLDQEARIHLREIIGALPVLIGVHVMVLDLLVEEIPTEDIMMRVAGFEVVKKCITKI